MNYIKINEVLCSACGDCVVDCPTKTLKFDDNNILLVKENNNCILCGHCEAICPEEAICIDNPDYLLSRKQIINKPFSEMQIAELMLSRRSIRNFKNKKVEKEKIEQIMDIVRFAPSARNLQPIKWFIIYNYEELNKLTDNLIQLLRFSMNSDSEFAKKYNFEKLINSWDKGYNPIFNNAQHLVFTYTHKKSMMPLVDSAIALSYFDLLLPTYELAGTFAGFFYLISQICPDINRIIGIPEDFFITGGIMFGYPEIEYKRLPKRKKLEITWK